MASVARDAANFSLLSVATTDDARLEEFVEDVSDYLRRHIKNGHRVVIEGTQGFGLSLLEGGHWPKATSRSTTAAGALSEAGLSPLNVDDITMVIRSYPIRVAGDSGPLAGETTWEEVARKIGCQNDLREYTTVTGKLRRVGYFDPEIVRRALDVNMPNRLVLNHLDYVGKKQDIEDEKSDVRKFINQIESDIDREVDWYGFSGSEIIDRIAKVV